MKFLSAGGVTTLWQRIKSLIGDYLPLSGGTMDDGASVVLTKSESTSTDSPTTYRNSVTGAGITLSRTRSGYAYLPTYLDIDGLTVYANAKYGYSGVTLPEGSDTKLLNSNGGTTDISSLLTFYETYGSVLTEVAEAINNGYKIAYYKEDETTEA